MYLHTIVTQGGGTGEVWQKGADPGPPQEEGIWHAAADQTDNQGHCQVIVVYARAHKNGRLE